MLDLASSASGLASSLAAEEFSKPGPRALDRLHLVHYLLLHGRLVLLDLISHLLPHSRRLTLNIAQLDGRHVRGLLRCHTVKPLLQLMLELLKSSLCFDFEEAGARYIDLLPLVTSFQATLNIVVLVGDDPVDDVARRDAIGPLRGAEHAQLFHIVIDIFCAARAIRGIIVCNVMYSMLLEEIDRDGPRAGADYLVDPTAMHKYLGSLAFVHHNLALLLDRLLVAADTYDKVNMLEQFFGLLEYFGMTNVEHVEDAVGVDSHGIVRIIAVRDTWAHYTVIVLGQAVGKQFVVRVLRPIFSLILIY